MKHIVVLNRERITELYGLLGRATPTLHERHRETFITLTDWCDDNVEGYEILNPSTWVFEREEDATLFKMVWG
jgi:hypothetical protein